MMRLNLDELNLVPQSTGVYTFWGEDFPLYIGKSVNLARRVYQHLKSKAPFINRAKALEYIVTSDEWQALQLEYLLISKYLPPYNLQFNQFGGYLFLVFIDNGDGFPYPSLMRLRNLRDIERLELNPELIVGPIRFSFKKGKSLIGALVSAYGLRRCKLDLRPGKFRKEDIKGCIYRLSGECSAPCEGKISRGEYLERLKLAIRHLREGIPQSYIDKLRDEMYKLAEELKFEQAAVIRDRLNALEMINRGKPTLDLLQLRSIMMVELKRTQCELLIATCFGDSIEDPHLFRLEPPFEEHLLEVLGTLGVKGDVEVHVDSIFLFETLRRILNKVDLPPADSHSRAFLELLRENAELRLRVGIEYPVFLQELSEKLQLEDIPIRLEAYDVSHISGRYSYSYMVVWSELEPDRYGFVRQAYRAFRVSEGGDDLKALKETAVKRVKAFRAGTDPSTSVLPDLIVIDGGLAQLKAFNEGLRLMGVRLPLIALPKGSSEITGITPRGEVTYPDLSSELRRLLYGMTAEAHRMANLRRRRAMHRVLNL